MKHGNGFRDLTGQRFTRWIVLAYAGVKSGRARWRVRCDCGQKRITRGDQLLYGNSRSCGCLRRKEHGNGFIDLTGQKFGRWTVIAYAGKNKNGHSLWSVRCECRTKKVVTGSNLQSGNTRSCGCLSREVATKRATIHGGAGRGKLTLEYVSWHSMRQRCRDENAPNYRFYGGRQPSPVTVCGRWLGEHGFQNFKADLGERTPGTSLGRILDLGNYEPGNAFWMTPAEQGLAQRNNKALLKWAKGDNMQQRDELTSEQEAS